MNYESMMEIDFRAEKETLCLIFIDSVTDDDDDVEPNESTMNDTFIQNI